MSSTMDRLLRQTTASTFEHLAFLVPDDECSETQAAAPLDATVLIEFHGPARGRLVLRVTSALLPLVAANMLGVEDAGHAALQRDALGEVANVLCGNLLPALAGRQAVFHLAAPAWPAVSVPARDGDHPVARVRLGLEHGCAEVALFVFSGHETFGVSRAAADAA